MLPSGPSSTLFCWCCGSKVLSLTQESKALNSYSQQGTTSRNCCNRSLATLVGYSPKRCRGSARINLFMSRDRHLEANGFKTQQHSCVRLSTILCPSLLISHPPHHPPPPDQPNTLHPCTGPCDRDFFITVFVGHQVQRCSICIKTEVCTPNNQRLESVQAC